MNVTVENLAPCRKMVRIEVDANAVDSAFESMTREFQREVKLPGFRPGKAPKDLVIRTYAKQIEEEVRKKLISDHYRNALSQHQLRVVGRPDVEEIQFGRGQSMQFAVTVETAPDFDLPEYKGLHVKRQTGPVTDQDVEKAVLVLREQRAQYQDVDRPAQAEDFVVVNYSGSCDGKPLTELAPESPGLAQQKNFWLQIRPESFVPGFTEQLIGAKAGDQRSVTVDFPSNFVASQLAGKKGLYEVQIIQVKERQLPELNEDFAKAYEAPSVEKLLEGVRNDLRNELDYKRKRDVRNQLVQALLRQAQFDLPESVVMSETRSVIYDLVRENQQRGVSKETIEKQKDEIYNYASNNARERVKIAFLLGRIAEKEKITVSQEEIAQRIIYLSQLHQIRPDKLAKQLQERDGIADIQEQIITGKVLDFLELNAQIQEVPASAEPRP